ncbi:NUDIX domain-containing protein [Laceyella putida]|uniref:NUDIX domain-containing protein n=1 Tax=Laceyella putida TaxID=110101 RepID=A0ABW2RQE1_9BACL
MKKWLRVLTKAYRLYCKLAKPVTLGSRAIVVNNHHILLVRHHYEYGWYLPGGAVKKGETFRQAILRELKEECGIVAEQAKLLHLFFSKKEGKNDHVGLFEVSVFTKVKPKRSIEIDKLAFFSFHDLP